MSTIFVYMLNHSIKITCVILLVILVRFLFLKVFRLPAKYAYILWGIVALRMILVISVSSSFSIFNVGSLRDADVLENVFNQKVQQIENAEMGESTNSTETTGMEESTNITETEGMEGNKHLAEAVIVGGGSDTVETTGADTDVNTNADTLMASLLQVVPVAAYTWLTGVLILYTYLLISYYMTKRKVDTAVHLSGNVYECDRIAGPFVFGLVKPRIYLPFGLQEEALSYVLMHENCHIKRKDPWIKCIAFLLVSIYWFNPLVWVAFYLAMSDMEMSVDEAVLLQMGNEVKKEYCLSLLAFASGNRSIFGHPGHTYGQFLIGPLAFGESGASKRIKNVLRFKKPGMWLVIAGVVLTVFIAVGCLTNGSSEGGEELYAEEAPDSEGINSSISNESRESNEGNDIYEELKTLDASYQARPDGIYLINEDGTEECLYEGYTGTAPCMTVFENRLFFMTDLNYEPGNADWSYNAICQVDTSSKECSVVELNGFAQGNTAIKQFHITEGHIGIWEANGSYRSFLLPDENNYVYGVKLKDLEGSEELQERVGLDTSDFLRDNPGTKVTVSFRTAEQTFAVLDFDGDGTVERLVLRPDEDVDTVYREGRLALDYFVLEVGDASLKGMADNLSNSIWAFSPDGEEIVFALYEDGPSDDPLTHFYCYEEGALWEIGALADDSRTPEITEDGIILAHIRFRSIQADWMEQQWRINDEHLLELIPQDCYPLTAGNDIELLCELPLLKEPGGEESIVTERIVVEPQMVRFIEVSNDEKWILMETASGEQGWFGIEYQGDPHWDYLITPVGKYADEVFEGLTQWAG